MSAVSELLKANEAFAASFDKVTLEILPAMSVLGSPDDVLRGKIRDETGIDVSDQEYLSFSDPEEGLRDDVIRLREVVPAA